MRYNNRFHPTSLQPLRVVMAAGEPGRWIRKRKRVKFYSRLFNAALILGGSACTSMVTDPGKSITAFNPYITKDGAHSFRFVAKSKLPSYFEGDDIRQIHEQQISNELGNRRYCTNGYSIASVTEVHGSNLVYEGVCK